MPHFITAGSVYERPRECRWPKCKAEQVEPDIPLCERHFTLVGISFLARRNPLSDPDRAARREAARADQETHLEQRAERMKAQSVVYYVRIGDHVKIGYTINLRQRLGALRVDDDALLATEPGGRQLERERHLEFAPERVGKRENFNPSRRLLAHIEAVRERHGEPLITDYKSSAA